MSIVRLVPSKTQTRSLLYAMNVTFGLACLTLLLQKIWVCSRNSSWHNNPAARCYIGNTLGYISLCSASTLFKFFFEMLKTRTAELSADACLIGIPLRMLWRVKLPRKQRRLILLIFASSVINSLAGIVYAVLVFVFNSQPDRQRWGYHIAMLAHMKVCFSIQFPMFVLC